MKIKDIATVVNGATPSSKNNEYYNGDIIWITPKDLSDQGTKYIYKGERNITKEGYDSCSTTLIPAENILMSSRAPIGLLAINKNECCTNQGFKNLVVNKDLCNVEFLYYYLKYHIKEIEQIGSGTTFKEVSKSAIEKYEIELPIMDKQIETATILSNIDAKIENNNKINEELESMAKTIYDYWFLQFEFPNEEGKPYKSSGGKMVWNEELKREIPEGWKKANLSKYGSLKNGINYKKDDIGEKKAKIINVRDISESSYFIIKSKLDSVKLKTKDINNYLLSKKDILITRSGTPGATRMIYDDFEDVIYSGFIIKYEVKDILMKNYLFYVLKTLEALMRNNSNGTIIGNINQETLKEFSIIKPKKDVITKFNNLIEPILKKIYKNNCENEELEQLRDFLLPLIMNGQVGFKELALAKY